MVRAAPESWLKYTKNADTENSKVTLKAKLIKLAENINFVFKLTDFVLDFELLFTSSRRLTSIPSVSGFHVLN